jgi:hypothetical protein
MDASKVYAFDADKSWFAIAEENIHLKGEDKIILMMSEEANSKNLSETICKNLLSNIFLKLDCEGCEYEIIPSITEAAYERIRDIAMEYHRDSHTLTKKLRDTSYCIIHGKKIMITEHIFASKNNKIR